VLVPPRVRHHAARDWQPIFDKHQVDIDFNGHVYNYERSNSIRGFRSGSTNGQIVGTYSG
jgi:hypothetical protein